MYYSTVSKSELPPEYSCAHDKGLVSNDIRVPDHYPISKEELVELMTVAVSSEDSRLRARIQRRLNRAVPNMVCPRPAEGITADKSTLIDHIYVNELQNGPTQDFIDKFFGIISMDRKQTRRVFRAYFS